LTAHK